ncbi:nucleoside-diphosphate kinase [Candidatus Saccharibacteria bacterium]|nr:nucleoside-diphosphate kinase [Candidatus Saccharibacteria bacterium]
MERTLIILKPDALQRGLLGEILSRFEKAGLKIVGMKMVHPNEQHYHHHYETISKLKSRVSEETYKQNTDFMLSAPVIAAVIEGVEAVSLVRKIVGDTEPKAAAPGTVRGDYSHMSIKHANEKGGALPNLIHASGNTQEAKEEIAHWFSENELFDYKTAHEHLTQNPKN